jgi:hypothetical protein
MSEKWGFKLEGALIYAHGERTQDNVTNTWSSKKATGLGLDAMGQVYWAITPNVSLTGGLEYRHIELGENVGRFGHFGLTTSLDFSF